jgi:hypothetical protein
MNGKELNAVELRVIDACVQHTRECLERLKPIGFNDSRYCQLETAIVSVRSNLNAVVLFGIEAMNLLVGLPATNANMDSVISKPARAAIEVCLGEIRAAVTGAQPLILHHVDGFTIRGHHWLGHELAKLLWSRLYASIWLAQMKRRPSRL